MHAGVFIFLFSVIWIDTHTHSTNKGKTVQNKCALSPWDNFLAKVSGWLNMRTIMTAGQTAPLGL